MLDKKIKAIVFLRGQMNFLPIDGHVSARIINGETSNLKQSLFRIGAQPVTKRGADTGEKFRGRKWFDHIAVGAIIERGHNIRFNVPTGNQDQGHVRVSRPYVIGELSPGGPGNVRADDDQIRFTIQNFEAFVETAGSRHVEPEQPQLPLQEVTEGNVVVDNDSFGRGTA
ncbi:MAG: hypothetical protein P4L76_05950 [Beijerinckiaceae bacterium]|nr:hypothetical protein [Beijerinckiaceae bacterium]